MSVPDENHAPIYRDLLAAAAIFFYSALWAAVRLAASPTMELDEAEQFLAAACSWKNFNQPPLYTHLLKAVYSICGVSGVALIGLKYAFIFFFFLAFYFVARRFWRPGHSIIVTASLSLYLTYVYDFNRQLTHTVLVSFLAAAACLTYFLLTQKKKILYYAAFGILAGLGILAKYNFIFFLAASVLASASCREGRKVLGDKKVLAAVAAAAAVITPHVVSMLDKGFPTISYALARTGAGETEIFNPGDFLELLRVFFVPVLPTIAVFFLFFGSSIRKEGNRPEGSIAVARWMGLYALAVPFITHLLLKSGSYNERWLAPVFFLVPLALFSYVDPDANQKRIALYGYCCVAFLSCLLIFRAAISFFPDSAGKVERIHIPFRQIAVMLTEDLKEQGIRDLREVTVGSDNWYLTANIAAEMPGIRTVDLRNETGDLTAKGTKRLLVWKMKKEVEIPGKLKEKMPADSHYRRLEAAYLHSTELPPFVLGYAVLRSDWR